MIKRFVLMLLVAACALTQGCGSLLPFGLGANRGKVSIEQIEKPDHFWTLNEVLVIPLSGVVDVGSMATGLGNPEPGMLVGLKDRLKAAEENPAIKAVILRIDSPGGSVSAADLIHREIIKFKEKKKVPVIALLMDTAASGGLYVAMAADEIYAIPTTVTGSIGVIMMLPGLQGLSNKIGFEMRVIKSGDNKDIGSPWRAMTEDERRIFQNLINAYYQHFLKVVLDSRQKKGLTGDKLNAIADGRVLDAATARDNNLIDGIMYPDDVIKLAKDRVGGDARIVSYEYPSAWRGNIYARGLENLPQMMDSARGGDFNLLKFDLGALAGAGKKPQFMYLWMP